MNKTILRECLANKSWAKVRKIDREIDAIKAEIDQCVDTMQREWNHERWMEDSNRYDELKATIELNMRVRRKIVYCLNKKERWQNQK